MGKRINAKVKWFNSTKGFGFLTPDDGSKELFCHYSAIAGEGYRELKEGQSVTCEVIETPKGLAAGDVRVES